MNHIEAMKTALEALAASDDFLFNYHDCEPNNEREMDAYSEIRADNHEAFMALRTAISQAESREVEAAEKQEPVASAAYDMVDRFLRNNLSSDADYAEYSAALDALYTTPPAAPVQEPVCAMCKSTHGKWSWMCGRCLLIHDKQPPAAQRQWVGLTLADKEEFLAQDFGGSRLDAMDWAARKLKEKNHG